MKKKSLLFIIVVVLCITLIIAGTFIGFGLSENYSINDDTSQAFSYLAVDKNFVCQSFTIGTVGNDSNFQPAGVSIKLKGDDTDTENLGTFIVSVNSTGNPTFTGNNINGRITNLTNASWAIPMDSTVIWYNITFRNGLFLNASTQYALCLNTTETSTDQPFWRYDNGDATYAGGFKQDYCNPTLTEAETSDYMFKIFGTESTGIVVTLTDPLENSASFLNVINFTCDSTSNQYSIINSTSYIWYFNGTLLNKTTNTTFVGDETKTNYTFSKASQYKYNFYTCGTYFNSYFCDWADSNYSFNYGYDSNFFKYNSTSYKTESETFTINITTNGSSVTNPSFYYNGTDYTTTSTVGDGNNYTLKSTLDIPNTLGNKSYYFTFQIEEQKINSSIKYQNISPVHFGLCNSTLTIPYLNISFRDEETDAWINASIDTSTWKYWLGSGTTTLSYSHINNTNNTDYEFCLEPRNRTATLNYTIQYSLSGYPQRRYATQGDYTNASTNKTLYLLASPDGIYVTFQVLSAAGQPIASVYGNASRDIGGTETLVGSGYTGTDGGLTFWLNPDYTHDFAFEKTGYSLYTTTLTPTQSSYTIYLSSVADETNISDYNRGINYNIEPEAYVLGNDTSYEFNFTITSTYWNLDEYGFVLRNDTGGTVLGSDSDITGTGGTTRVTIDTKQNSTIVMDYYWIIDGNYTNMTRSWSVSDIADYGFSIKTFFIDLRNYANQKTLGLNTFSLNLIIFVIIFLIVGSICYMSGVYSPAAVMWMIFALVALFDYGAELIYNPINAVSYFPTIFVFFMAIGFTIWEATR